MKRKLTLLLTIALVFSVVMLLIFLFNQLSFFASFAGQLHPFAGFAVLGTGIGIFCILAVSLFTFWRPFTRTPALPENEASSSFDAYLHHLGRTQPTHHKHPDPLKHELGKQWITTNHRLLEMDAMSITKELAIKNFFVGALAQSTAYGTTTSLNNNLKLLWRIYALYNKKHYARDLFSLYRFTYASLPLSDFNQEELPAHIKPIIQSSFSNTLSTLLPGGNLLTPLFLNFFLAGATNTYLTCLSGLISTYYCESLSEENRTAIAERSRKEASLMLKSIIKECNPVLSQTISSAVKNAGIESLDSVETPSSSGSLAQDFVSHVAQSLKQIIRENVRTEKGTP